MIHMLITFMVMIVIILGMVKLLITFMLMMVMLKMMTFWCYGYDDAVFLGLFSMCLWGALPDRLHQSSLLQELPSEEVLSRRNAKGIHSDRRRKSDQEAEDWRESNNKENHSTTSISYTSGISFRCHVRIISPILLFCLHNACLYSSSSGNSSDSTRS